MNNFDHWSRFAEFVKYEMMTGGPDPHMAAVVSMMDPALYNQRQRAWMAHLYVGFYNVPSAEVTFEEFSDHPRSSSMTEISAWLERNWHGLKTRRERRTVKSPLRMTQYLAGFDALWEDLQGYQDVQFDDLWALAMSLPHVGRYAATKLCEIWERLELVSARCPDIRARGGWSPREALRLLYPEERHDAYDDAQIDQAEDLAKQVHVVLEEQGLPISMFQLEVMLCEYKASYSTKRQFPGRSLDSELKYERAVREYWPVDECSEHMAVRAQLSPDWALGEVQGWDPDERLKKLGSVLSQYGYTWSDYLYDYNATNATADFANPVRREHE